MTKPEERTIKEVLRDVHDHNARDFVELASIIDESGDLEGSVRYGFDYHPVTPLYSEYQDSSEGLSHGFLTEKGIECWRVLKSLAKDRTNSELIRQELIRQVYLTYASLSQKR